MFLIVLLGFLWLVLTDQGRSTMARIAQGISGAQVTAPAGGGDASSDPDPYEHAPNILRL